MMVFRGIVLVLIGLMLVGAMCHRTQNNTRNTIATRGDVKDDKGNTSAVTGLVIDSVTTEPLEGVSVQLQGTTLGALSDNRGRFRIAQIAPGLHTLMFTYVGYKKTETLVDILSNSTTELKLSLSPQAIDTKAQTVRCSVDSWVVEGLVKDRATSVPIRGAKVRVNPGNSKTKTDQHGRFRFSFRGGGISDITIAHKLYQTVFVPVTKAEEDSIVSVNVSLIPK